MKKRTIMISLVVLGFLLMIGVGFAAWTITNPNASQNTTAAVEAYAVQSKDYNLTLSFVKSDGSNLAEGEQPAVIFGKPADASAPEWLSADADVKVESLKLYLKVSVDKVQNLPTNGLTISFACSETDAWDACTITDSYIAGPTYSGTGVSSTSIAKTAFGSATEGAASCIVEITFAWGSAFTPQGASAGVNPYIYYNGLDYSSDNALAATTALTAIYELNEATYTFTIAPATAE